MPSTPAPDVSVLLPFADDEDFVGTACQRVADHLHELGLSFEILAIDEDSGDNSHAVLGLLRTALPELRTVTGGQMGRGFQAGASAARGRTLWLVEPQSATRSLSAFGRAHGRVARGELDLAVVRGRFAVIKRARALGMLDALGGRGAALERRLVKRAGRRGLAVEAYDVGGARPLGGLAERLRLRLSWALAALEPRT